MDALIAQHPNDIGRIGAKMAVDYPKTNKKPANKTVKTGLSVVTRNNVSGPKFPNIFTKPSVENSAPVAKKAGRLIRKAPGDVCSTLDQLRALKHYSRDHVREPVTPSAGRRVRLALMRSRSRMQLTTV